MSRQSLLLLLITLSACGGQQVTEGKSEAQIKYEQAQELLEDQHPIEARELFNQVKNDFPFSPYAALAAIGVGHAFFDQELYPEAIDAYRAFVRSYPEHPEVATAVFRQAKSHFVDRPADMAILPPPYERDRAATNSALSILRRFLTKYPDDRRASAAQEMLRECRQTKADYELYVARFYLDRKKPWAARLRLETLVRDFEDTPLRWRQAVLMLVGVYLELGTTREPDIEPLKDGRKKAIQLADRLRNLYPKSSEASHKDLEGLR